MDATAISLIIAAAALALSVVNYIEARETAVRWRVEIDPDPDHGVEIYARLVNVSARFAAVVIDVSDPDLPPALQDGTKPSIAVRFEGPLPAVVEPGNWIRIQAWQFESRPPTRIRVRWRQRRATGWFVRPIVRSTILYR